MTSRTHTARNRRRHRNAIATPGFSLPELLVVTATATTLMALVLPSLQGGIEAARSVQCGTNQNQLVMAGHAWANDRRGAWCLTPPPQLDSSNWLWTAVTNGSGSTSGAYQHYGRLNESYLSSAEAYYCPSGTTFTHDDPMFGAANLGVLGAKGAGSYIARGIPQGGPRTAQDRPAPAVLVDILEIPRRGYANNHHGGAANAAYLDGSVQMMRAPEDWQFATDIHGNDSALGAGDGAWSQLDRRELE